MIIWKGHGILILVFGVIGSLVAGMAVSALFFATHWTWMARLMICAPFWGAAAAIWTYAKTMGKPTEQTLLDPTTRMPVIIRSSHSLFFIPPVPWAVIAAVMAVGMSFSALIMPASTFEDKGTSSSGPGSSAFDAANRLITSDKGKEAYGNTPDAEKLAAEFAELVKLGRKMGVQAATKSTFSLSKGKFLTYCRVNPDSCAFMVHVPDLRKFSQDAKDLIAYIAWATAMDAARSLDPQPKHIAVGIRGAFLYDTVTVGNIVAEDVDAEDGVEKRHTDSSPEKNLAAFFEAPAATATMPRLKTAEEVAQVERPKAVNPNNPAPTPEIKAPPVQEKKIPVPENSAPPSVTATPPPPAAPAAPTLPTPVREWKDSTGRVLKASLESFTTPAHDTARFKREDGQKFDVPVSRFSDEDQAFISKLVPQ